MRSSGVRGVLIDAAADRRWKPHWA